MGDGLTWNPAPTVTVTIEDQHGRVMCRPKELKVVQGKRADVEPMDPWSVRMNPPVGKHLSGEAEVWDGREYLPVTTIHNDVKAHGDAEITVTTYVKDPGYVPPRSDGSWPWGSGTYADELADREQAKRRVERTTDEGRHRVRRPSKLPGDWVCSRCGAAAADVSVLTEFPCPGDTIE